MSEANNFDVSKAEKLRLRQEKLAKWKSKKALTPSHEESPSLKEDNNNGSNTETNSDQELGNKKLERLKKLEEWKRKRQVKSDKHPSQIQGSSGQRLEAWRKKRTENSGFKASLLIKSETKISKTRRPLNNFSSLFAGNDDRDDLPRFKKPTLSKPNELDYVVRSEENAGDSIDMYLKALEADNQGPNSTSSAQLSAEDSDLDTLDVDEQQKLLSTKIKNLQKEKELLVVDHSQINYPKFKKKFYEEPESVKCLLDEEIQLLRLSMDGIKVTGSEVPAPIWEWEQLGLSSLIVSILKEQLKFQSPTSIQSQAMPAIMSGRDFLGIAKTGSGKTLGFILPLLRHVQDQPSLSEGDGPIGILLTPTRELALQIYKVLISFTKKLSITTACCYGGSSIEPQIAELKKGAQIVVATPGRLIDLLAANGGRICNLKRVTYVVLDEADRMFDFGFEPQVNKIFSQIRPDRQSILFSATFAKKMEMLAKSILINPVEVIVGGISVVPPEVSQKVKLFELKGHETEEQISDLKFQALLDTILDYPTVKKLIFVEKQDSADKLLVKLLAQNKACVVIHGGKEQVDRKYAIQEFSDSSSGVDIMLATSIAARGLDVKGLDLVINYDPANHMEDYVHRVGRTGRAGMKGDAFTFVTSLQERAITDLVKAMRLSKIPDEDIDSRLITIADNFISKVKHGKEKYRFGFGGNGLTKLDEVRKSNQLMERKAYDAINNSMSSASAPSPKIIEKKEIALDLPEFNIIEGKADETSGPDKCKFHSRITINDLPQKARWVVVNADNLAQIIEATSTSITNKGQYYPPNTKIPATIKKGGRDIPSPPKLYLLVEGLTEISVKEANRMIRQKMIEGLEQAGLDDNVAPTGKYKV